VNGVFEEGGGTSTASLSDSANLLNNFESQNHPSHAVGSWEQTGAVDLFWNIPKYSGAFRMMSALGGRKKNTNIPATAMCGI